MECTKKRSGKKLEFAFQKPTSKKDVHKDAKKLRALISEDTINTLAKSSGWLNRERKFTGMALLKAMVFISNGHYQLSLRERCCELLNYGVKLSKQALDKRLNDKASVFIKSVLEQVLHLKLIEGSRVKLLSGFSGINIIDATSFQLPEHLSHHYKGPGGGASKSAVKPHYCLSITGQGHQMGLAVVDGVGPDTGSGLVNVQKGELLLFDLGYFSFSNLERIACSKGYYLSRIKYSTQVWIKTTQGFKPLDWQKHMARMQGGQIEALQVYLGDEKKVKTRLIIEKIPDQIAAEKRRNLKTSMSHKSKSCS
ncbi:MAG: IS4 family transposase, partial [Bacteroidota bacterium]